jgi:hypothetical protein
VCCLTTSIKRSACISRRHSRARRESRFLRLSGIRLAPAFAGLTGMRRGNIEGISETARNTSTDDWIPAFAGMTGETQCVFDSEIWSAGKLYE